MWFGGLRVVRKGSWQDHEVLSKIKLSHLMIIHVLELSYFTVFRTAHSNDMHAGTYAAVQNKRIKLKSKTINDWNSTT